MAGWIVKNDETGQIVSAVVDGKEYAKTLADQYNELEQTDAYRVEAYLK